MKKSMPTIHPTAIIADSVQLSADVTIGPFCLLEGDIIIGAGTELKANVHLWGTVEIGEQNTIHSNAVIGDTPQDLSYDKAVSSGVTIGNGNTIRENVTIHRGAGQGGRTILGNHSFLMAGSHLGHDCVVGDHTILANNTLLGGHSRVGKRVFLGGGTVVHQCVHIGDYGMTQGNSGLSQDLPPYCVSHGINLLAGLNVIGMRRGGFSAAERKEIKILFTLLFQSGKNLTESIKEAESKEWNVHAQHLLKAAQNPSKKGLMRR